MMSILFLRAVTEIMTEWSLFCNNRKAKLCKSQRECSANLLNLQVEKNQVRSYNMFLICIKKYAGNALTILKKGSGNPLL